MCWWRSSWGGFQPPLLIGALSHSLDFFCLVLIIMRCKGKKCRKAPQSGYEGYCKSCFRLKFPSRHASKQERRRKECPCCGETKELHSSGVCRPCMRARSCIWTWIWNWTWPFPFLIFAQWTFICTLIHIYTLISIYIFLGTHENISLQIHIYLYRHLTLSLSFSLCLSLSVSI